MSWPDAAYADGTYVATEYEGVYLGEPPKNDEPIPPENLSRRRGWKEPPPSNYPGHRRPRGCKTSPRSKEGFTPMDVQPPLAPKWQYFALVVVIVLVFVSLFHGLLIRELRELVLLSLVSTRGAVCHYQAPARP